MYANMHYPLLAYWMTLFVVLDLLPFSIVYFCSLATSVYPWWCMMMLHIYRYVTDITNNQTNDVSSYALILPLVAFLISSSFISFLMVPDIWETTSLVQCSMECLMKNIDSEAGGWGRIMLKQEAVSWYWLHCLSVKTRWHIQMRISNSE